MKIKKLILIFFSIFSINVNASEINYEEKFLPLKDFLILKFDIFIQRNLINIFEGGGMLGIAYQKVDYKISLKKNDEIMILLKAVMDKERYSSKKYFPKLKDCNQIRNKLFTNKYGYSFFTQKFNNLVNYEVITNSINNNILNISSLSENFKKQIVDNTILVINIFHPDNSKNISCSGKIADTKLKLLN